MRTNIMYVFIVLTLLHTKPALADTDKHTGHGDQIFHMFRLETDVGAARHDMVASWDFDGWIGGDYNKLWLKSEGENKDGKTEKSEFWAMYSRNISNFWDGQIGIRHDTKLRATNYLVAGFNGLAPYFFETEAHMFISNDGNVSFRLRQENDFLVTQRLILQPYVEANIYAQEVAKQEVGAGFSSAEIGLQTRYEISRKFAPYVDLRYERKFTKTASIAKQHLENKSDMIASIGVRLLF
ncbi:MAG: copper resistance protein B [Rickettsiales bacterium]